MVPPADEYNVDEINGGIVVVIRTIGMLIPAISVTA